jgi:hypothetical protein
MIPVLECVRKVYRVESGPCFDILTEWREQRRIIAEQAWSWVEGQGGSGFIPGHDDNVGNAQAIKRVIFEGKLPQGWLQRSIRLASPLKQGQVTAVPDKRTTIGKALEKEIKALPLRPSSSKPCTAIGYPHALSYARPGGGHGVTSLGLFETMQVGWIADGPFYVSLPDERAERQQLEERGYTVEGEPWEPLPGMVEILKEEMDLDFARAKLAQAGAA